jgi:hypothetical protein
MELPGKQQELINRVASVAKKPVVLVLLSGGLVIPAKLEEVRWRVSIRYCCLGSPASTYPAISKVHDTTLRSCISLNNWGPVSGSAMVVGQQTNFPVFFFNHCYYYFIFLMYFTIIFFFWILVQFQ